MFFIDPTAAQLSPLDWLLTLVKNLHWPVIVVLIWKVRGWLNKLEKQGQELVDIIKASHTDLQAHAKEVKDFKDTFAVVSKTITDQTKDIKDLNASVQQFMEQAKHQTEVHTEQFRMLRGIAEQQTALGTNQKNITDGMQRVVEQLISLVKE